MHALKMKMASSSLQVWVRVIFILPWDKREEFLLVLCYQILLMGRRFNWRSLEHHRLPGSKYQAQHLLDVKLNGKFNSLRTQIIFTY